MPEQPLIFECEGSRLVGILHRPEGDAEVAGRPRVGIVIVVGGPQYRVGSHRQFTVMARAFCAAGYAVLRFDYRGMGDSEGEGRSFEDVDSDIRAALDALLREVPSLESALLWGLCDAASACLIYAHRRDPRVSGLVLANPWVRTLAGEAKAYLRHYYFQRLLQKSLWEKVLRGAFNPLQSLRELTRLFARTFSRGEAAGAAGTRANFVERMHAGLEGSTVPVLLLISEVDLTAKEFVDHCASRTEWQALLRQERIRRESLAGIDHTFSGAQSMRTVIGVCLSWMTGLRAGGAG